MNIGVPKETAANERRVALTPEVAGRLAKSGWAVLVERGAGEAASFGDESYGTAGATLVAATEVFGQSDVVLKDQPPRSEETRLNSSHSQISYAVFCLKKKKTKKADMGSVDSISPRRDGIHPG